MSHPSDGDNVSNQICCCVFPVWNLMSKTTAKCCVVWIRFPGCFKITIFLIITKSYQTDFKQVLSFIVVTDAVIRGLWVLVPELSRRNNSNIDNCFLFQGLFLFFLSIQTSESTAAVAFLFDVEESHEGISLNTLSHDMAKISHR